MSNDLVAPEQVMVELDNELQALAMAVKSNDHLRAIIRSTDPHLRHQVYKAIVPHLKFRPMPYLLLK